MSFKFISIELNYSVDIRTFVVCRGSCESVLVFDGVVFVFCFFVGVGVGNRIFSYR